MSISNVRTYFQNIVESLDYAEHTDGFAFDNIANNILDRTYFVSFSSMIGGPVNQSDQRVEVPVELRVFFKGYDDPQSAINDAMESGESLITELCKLSNRKDNNLFIKNVVFDTMSVEPLADSNDNSMILLITFDVLYIFDLI